MRQPGEPSVEDILDSIKRVISRDNRQNVSALHDTGMGERAMAANGHRYTLHDDVLDLAVAGQFLDAGDHDYGATHRAGRVANDDDENSAPLAGEDTSAAMRESLAALARMMNPAPTPADTSLEGLVREALKPALADWLDRNLPALVERMVAAEIARIVGKQV